MFPEMVPQYRVWHAAEHLLQASSFQCYCNNLISFRSSKGQVQLQKYQYEMRWLLLQKLHAVHSRELYSVSSYPACFNQFQTFSIHQLILRLSASGVQGWELCLESAGLCYKEILQVTASVTFALFIMQTHPGKLQIAISCSDVITRKVCVSYQTLTSS